MITGLVHIGITVLDFETMLGFYRDVLGLSVDAVVPHPRGGRKACLRGSDREVIELISYPNPKSHQGRDSSRTGIHHFGFIVDDVRRERERLAQLGVEIDGEIKVNAKGELVLHLFDPEGNRLHLTQPRSM
jgi:catechol 2,3-dioxygenase-like lactoylglutathione lyase family enzyme